MAAFRSGFVAILGRPNVGKSSIMNHFVGEKVAIVSNRPQTTRSRLLGVANAQDVQIVFVDTPGIHKPKTRLGEYMVKSANDAREGVDAVLAVVDAQFIGEGDRAILEDLRQMKCPKFLAVNKIDLADPVKLMPQLEKLNHCGFDEIVTTSARTGENMDTLFRLIADAMPEGPKYFPDDMMTDQPERILCAEIIREKGLLLLKDEVPHGLGVDILQIRQVREGLTEIHADLYCDRASHKSIIIGKQGSMLKQIGTAARIDIEKMMGTKVILRLWVKVREGWRDRASDLKTLGYTED